MQIYALFWMVVWWPFFMTLYQPIMCDVDEERLFAYLFANRTNLSRLSRPVLRYNDAVNVSLKFDLQQVIDVDEKNQVILLNVWIGYYWKDPHLAWQASDFGGITEVNFPPSFVWKPDVLLYNSIDEKFDTTYPSNVVANNDSFMQWMPPAIIKATCKIDISWFPFDDQFCTFKFGSWTYNGFLLDLSLSGKGVDTNNYMANGEWLLVELSAKRNSEKYTCCPAPFVDVTVSLWIRRRTLYYMFNLVVPCILISFLTCLGFTLPADSGERLALGVTIFMSLTVFMLMVAESMPPTSETLPLIGIYFASIMVAVSGSVALTVLVLNLYYRPRKRMRGITRKIFMKILPRMMCMEFITAKQIVADSTGCSHPKSDLTLPSDIMMNGWDTTHVMTPSYHRHAKHAQYNKVNSDDSNDVWTARPNIIPKPSTECCCGLAQKTKFQWVLDANLSPILKELRFLTDQVKQKEEQDEIIEEWRFAALILDRLSLVLLVSSLVASTIWFLVSAPQIWT